MSRQDVINALNKLKEQLKKNGFKEESVFTQDNDGTYPTIKNFKSIIETKNDDLTYSAIDYMDARNDFYKVKIKKRGGKKRTRRGKSRSRKSRKSRKKKRTKKRRT